MPGAYASRARASSTCSMRSADSACRTYGIIGYPLRHTASPAIHNAAFRLLGLPHVYAPYPLAPAALGRGLTALRDLGVQGLNVTVPHKEAVLQHLDSVTATASSVGAVNTLVVTRGGWRGDNTDIHGFGAPLRRYRSRLRGRSGVIIGAGGGARAAAFALVKDFGISALLFIVRSPRRAERCIEWAGELDAHVPASVEALSRPATWRAAFEEAAIIVQATSVGMTAARLDDLLLRGLRFRSDQLAYDLVYGRTTAFVRRARRQGAVATNGTHMLWAQAALSFKLWTGRPFPLARVQEQVGVP